MSERSGPGEGDAARSAPSATGVRPSGEAAKVLRAFVVDGRLRSIPAREKKKLIVLRWLVDRAFPDDRVYPEAEVNMRLALVHPDVAALRRYLVDAGLMRRANGEYRRVAPVDPEGSPGWPPLG